MKKFLIFIASVPGVKVKWMPRLQNYRITYKAGSRYAHSWDIWNHVKFMYETTFKAPITSDELHLRVFEKYITVQE